MMEQVSLYRELEAPAIVFYNKNVLPHVNVPHLHSQYEFYYNIVGAEGMFAEKKFYECIGRDLFLIPRTSVHKVIVPKEIHYERCIINIDAALIDAVNHTPVLNAPLKWIEEKGEKGPVKVNLDTSEHQELMRLVEAYHLQSKNGLKQYAKLLEMLDFIGERFACDKGETARIRQPQTLPEQALTMIEERFRDLKIADLSDMLYVSNGYLSALFKEAYGITLEQYLIIRKIAEAKKYLYMGVPVRKACELSGFHDYSNFIRTFKKFEGCSPSNLKGLTAPL